MSQCNHTRGTNHMFKRMSQLRQEGLQSLNTSSISLITYSIAHFPSSSIPYYFPCFLCLLLKNCKEIHFKFHPLRCSPLIAFSSGNKDKGKKGREARKSGQSKGGRGDSSRVIPVLIWWGCNGLRLIWSMRPAHCLLPQLNEWQGQSGLPLLQRQQKLKAVGLG